MVLFGAIGWGVGKIWDGLNWGVEKVTGNSIEENVVGGVTGAIGDLVRNIGDAMMNIMQGLFLPYSPEAARMSKVKESYARELLNEEEIEGAQYTELKEDLNSILYNTDKPGEPLRGEDEFKNDLKQYLVDNKKDELKNYISENGGDPAYAEQMAEQMIEASVSMINEKRIFPMIIYTPRAIFSNIVPLFDVNFLSPKVAMDKRVTYDSVLRPIENQVLLLPTNINYEVAELNGNEEQNQDTLKQSGNAAFMLSSVIASWYRALRNIAIIVSLSTLVYAGIRIILSSAASEKAEYKSMLKDWLVGICLILSLHYIMAFSLNMVETITKGIAEATKTATGGNVDTFVTATRLQSEYAVYKTGAYYGTEDQITQLGYGLMYLIIAIYTAAFSWKYIKRFLYMAFLTIISPLIAVTYAIDKVKDNEAQSFNMWVKEYLINLAIQPFHLLMYTMLISSATKLAETNVLYGIAVIAFMNEIETLIKKFFGLNKAEGGGINSPALTGASIAAASGAAQRLFSRKKDEKDDNSELINNRKANSNAPANISAAYGNAMPGGSNSSGGSGGSSNSNSGGNIITSRSSRRSSSNRSRTANRGPRQSRLRMLGRRAFGSGNIKPKITIKGTRGRTRGRTLGAPARYYRYNGRRVLAKAGRVAKKATRFGAKVAGATALGTVGLAAGLAGDGPGAVWKGVAGGMAAGWALGSLGANTTFKAAKGTRNMMRGAVGMVSPRAYQRAVNRSSDRAWLTDKSTENYYKQKYGRNWRRKMYQGLQLRGQGITDQAELDKGTKLMDQGLNEQQAGAIVNFARGLTKGDVMKDPAKIKNSLQNAGLSSAQADNALGYIEDMYGIPRSHQLPPPSTNGSGGGGSRNQPPLPPPSGNNGGGQQPPPPPSGNGGGSQPPPPPSGNNRGGQQPPPSGNNGGGQQPPPSGNNGGGKTPPPPPGNNGGGGKPPPSGNAPRTTPSTSNVTNQNNNNDSSGGGNQNNNNDSSGGGGNQPPPPPGNRPPPPPPGNGGGSQPPPPPPPPPPPGNNGSNP